MSSFYNKNPFIILGVHRSGTTLMSKILSAMDIHMGKSQNIHKEADFFFSINEKILRENQSTAYDFKLILQKLNEPDFLNSQSETTEKFVQKKIKYKFFGISDIFKNSIKKTKVKWGFKDPRTVLLLPLWIKLFPEAKLLIILRNPVDVSLSLYYFEKKRWEQKLKKRPNLPFGMPLDRAFGIWRNFTELLLKASDKYSDKSLLVKYEELKDAGVIEGIIKFTQSQSNPAKIKKMIIDKPSNYPKPKNFEHFVKTIKTDEFTKKLYPDLNL